MIGKTDWFRNQYVRTFPYKVQKKSQLIGQTDAIRTRSIEEEKSNCRVPCLLTLHWSFKRGTLVLTILFHAENNWFYLPESKYISISLDWEEKENQLIPFTSMYEFFTFTWIEKTNERILFHQKVDISLSHIIVTTNFMCQGVMSISLSFDWEQKKINWWIHQEVWYLLFAWLEWYKWK